MGEQAAPRVALEIVQGDSPWGTIVLELNADKAPLTTENFLKYVDDGFYDGTIFHRVISRFMVQGGGFSGIGTEKRKGLRAPVKNEAANGLSNARGTVAMARTNDPHSATAQFFINVTDNGFLNHPGQDGWGYCVFAKVVEGLDVLDKVKDAPVKASTMMGGEMSEPVTPATVKTARRVKTS